MRLSERPLPTEATERLKELQKKKGYTIAQMADYIGMAASTYQRYRAGTVPMYRHTLKKLPDREYEYVCYGVNISPRWKELTPDQKRRVNEFIESL